MDATTKTIQDGWGDGMSRLIDADKAIDYVNNLITVHRYYHPRSTTENFPISEVIAKINEVPTIDAVPVVRCKDCKFFCEQYFSMNCSYHASSVCENWFCSQGRVKE